MKEAQAVKILRRCADCLNMFEIDDAKKTQYCPKCRSRIGRARQKSIQKSARKKKKGAKE